MEAASLAAPLRPRLTKSRSKGDRHGVLAAVDDLELAPLADGALMDVAR
jgi:hypothetical protein